MPYLHTPCRLSCVGVSADNVCAIIVTHNPDEGFGARMDRLSSQFPAIYIVDNASSELGMIASGRVHVRRNDTNIGVGGALNQGLSDARADGYAWAVTFDQDSEPSGALLETMLSQASELGAPPFLLGANYWDVHRARLACKAKAGDDAPIPRTTLITSGMLLPIQFAQDIGGFREDYFIDSIDHEFCLRAARYGARVAMTAQPLMQHAIGSDVLSRHWARALATAHPPLRKYYMARNVIWTIRLHGAAYPLWALRQGLRLMAEALGMLAFREQRKERLAAFVKGVRDGLFRSSHG